jgi:type IV pilus assembly protein PilO
MFDKLFKIPLKIRLIIEILIIVVICGVYYYFYYLPKIEEIDRLVKDYDTLAIKVSQLRPIDLSYDQFKKEVELLNDQFNMVLKILPNEKSFNVLYTEVVGLAEKSGAKVTLFQPVGESKIDEFHSKVNFNIDMVTGYLELINYLYRLNYLDKIINLNTFSITPTKNEDGLVVLSLKASLNSYRFNFPSSRGNK